MAHLSRAARAFFCVALAFVADFAGASPPEVDRGVAWLSQQVQASGSVNGEASSIATVFQARTEALATLSQLSTAPSSLATLVAPEPESTTEYLARKITVLGPLGRDVSAAVASLTALQNPDGGFGGAAGYTSNPLDTSYALLAFKSSGTTGSAAVASALAYLAAVQAADGSFGINEQPSVYVSAYALQAFNAFASSNSVATPAQAVKSWLAGRQSAGAYASTLENALACIALAGVAVDTSLFSGAQAALKSAQSLDGSWSDDPYLTALAVRALVAAAAVPAAPTTGQVSATIVDAATGAPIAGAIAQAVGPITASANSDATGAVTIVALPPGSYAVQVAKTGYATVSLTASVAIGVTTNLGTVRLQVATGTATLQGTVRDGTSGLGLAGATIAVNTGPSTTTDASGNYVLTGIAPGSGSLTVSKTGYQTLSATFTLPADVVTAFSPSLYPAGQTPTDATVKGKVVDRVSGAAIAGASVSAGTATATTDASGAFTLPGLAAGSVTISVTATGYQPRTFSGVLGLGTNDVGSLALDRQATSATISGTVSDAATHSPIGGATVGVQGTTLAATTDATGAYRIAGVTQTQFTLVASAAGYQSKNIAVTLPSLADTAINIALDKVAPSVLTITSVTTDQPAYDPFATLTIAVNLHNLSAASVGATVAVTVFDPAGNSVIDVGGIGATVPAGGDFPATVQASVGSLAAATYSIRARAFDSGGTLQAEGTASFRVNAVTRIGGNVTMDPPIVQAGTPQTVHVTASLANRGNLAVPAGAGKATMTLVTPDPSIGAKAGGQFLPGQLVGSPLKSPIGAGLDAQGNFYTVNSATEQLNGATIYRVIKITPDGATTTLATLSSVLSSPTLGVFPVDAVADAAGNVYVLNSSSEIFKISPTGVLSRNIVTGLSGMLAFDRDASGNFTILVTGFRVVRTDASGGSQTTVFQGNGLSSPHGIARGADGALYVTNQTDNSIARVALDGTITRYVTSGLSSPSGIARGPDGNLYVANSGGNNIIKVTGLEQKVTYASGFSSPNDLAFDVAGNLYVTNSTNASISLVTANGTTVTTFAQTIVSQPQGMSYDAAGNLYVAGGSVRLVKLDTAGNVSSLSTALSSPIGVAVGFGGAIFVANSGSSSIGKVAGTTTTFATGFASSSPTGLAFNGTDTLYATDTQANRIVGFNSSGQSTAVIESLAPAPQAIRVAANGDRYIVNSLTLAVANAGGGGSVFVKSGLTNASSLAFALDGGFWVQELHAVKHVNGTSPFTVTTLNGSLPTLANGIVAESSGSVLVADSDNIRILRIAANGTQSPLASLPGQPSAIVSDQAGGLYAALTTGSIVQVSGTGTVTPVTTINPTSSRIAFDAVARKIYALSSTGIVTFDLATHVTAPLLSQASLNAIEFGSGQVFATNGATKELVSISLAGQPTTVLAGFVGPGPIVWDGSRLIFGDTTRVFTLVPGGYPQILATGNMRDLAWRGGTLFATSNNTTGDLLSFRPGVDTVPQTYIAALGSRLGGLAVRSDGALTINDNSTGNFWTYDAGKNLVASYTGLQSPSGIAVDPASGNVFVSITGQIVRLPPAGKQSFPFLSGTFNGLTFDSAGHLVAATSSGTVLAFDASGATLSSLSSPDGKSLLGVSSTDAGIFAVDNNLALVRKASGAQLLPFATGLAGAKGVRADATGGVLVANNDNGTVVRVAANQLQVRASGMTQPQSIAFAANGDMLVGGANGSFYAVGASGTPVDFLSLGTLYAVNAPNAAINSLAVNAAGVIYSVTTTRNEVDKAAYFPAGVLPASCTTPTTLGTAMGAIPVGGTSAALDFGSWTPPCAGDFRVSVTTASASGEAFNQIHVGPNATAVMAVAQPKLAPGNSAASITVNVSGADFTTFSKLDTSSIRAVISAQTPFPGFFSAIGSDAAGNVYVVSSGSNVTRYTPSGTVTSNFFNAGAAISMSGAVPVDDQQNVYIAAGTKIYRVPPAGLQSLPPPFATLAESIRSLVRGSGDVIYALGTASIFRIAQAGTVTTLPTGVITSGSTLTIDGKDNLYVQMSGDNVDAFRADGTRANVMRHDARGEPQFEDAGNITGDCADNLFVLPINWSALGFTGNEEHNIVQIIGRTGQAAQVMEGNTTSPSLTIMQVLSYDRFSHSILVGQEGGSAMSAFRIPVTCGGISADLHVVFPATQPAAGFSVAPRAVLTQADGSREYVWSLNDVTNFGRTLAFGTTLQSLAPGETRAVASSAFLAFQNTFVPGTLTVPVKVPTIAVDGMVDITASTDHPQYPANTNVVTDILLTPRDGTAKSGVLTAEITDRQGSRVALIAQQPVTIPAAGLHVQPLFNTGTYLTGSYVVKATLADGASGAVLVTGSAGFDIVVGGATLVASVTTDKQAYDAFDTVNVTARVANVSLNSVAANTIVRVVVTDPTGHVVLDSSATVPVLVPQALKDSRFVLPLTAAVPGSYTVDETLSDGTSALGEAHAAFGVLSTADSGSGLRGTVSATALANRGDPVAITATARNDGNAALTGITLNLKVVNAATGDVVQTWTQGNVTIAQGADTALSQTWSTANATAGNYLAVASATLAGGREVTLGQAAIRVGAIQAFSFTARTGVALNTVVESETITIAGIVLPAVISIDGGQYRINAGQYTSQPGTVRAGDAVTVKVTAASTFNTIATANLTVAGFTAPFNVTTVNPRTTPDPFSFIAQTGVPVNTVVVSNTVPITGIEIPVSISIVGGEYSVNGGAFTLVDGLIAPGSSVAVRLTSAPALNTLRTAVLNISGVLGTFDVTTTAIRDTPDPFAFTAQTNVKVSTPVVSNKVTITGINVSVPIVVTGGEYQKNLEAFTTAPGTIAAGDTVTLRLTSSASFSTTKSAVVQISNTIASFSVTTEAERRTPDAFSFAAQTNVPLSSQRTSNAITISGINTTVPVSVSAGGEYSKNNAPFTSADGTVGNGDTLSVRQTSSAFFATTTTATLTVSTVSASFNVTTIPFAFTAQVNVPLATVVASNVVTIAGVATTAPISIVGGEYNVNGGAFVTTAGTVRNGDVVIVRQTSSPDVATKTTATLTVGSYAAAFDVTTIPFFFVPQIDVERSTPISSNAVTMALIDTTAAISIQGGSYNVNGGVFTSAAGTVVNGDVVIVRQTSSSSFSTKTTATLTVGAYSAPFDVTTRAARVTPNAFSFTAITNAPLSTPEVSNPVTITGIETGVPVTIAGGDYSLNGGAFTTAAGTVNANDTIVVRQTSAATFSTLTTATLTVSNVSAAFTVTTVAEDRTPDTFGFNPQVDVELNTVVSSNRVTITGINTTVPISITGGQYSVNGGAFTANQGTVKANDTVIVQQTSASAFATTTVATLTVSTVTASFSVTTKRVANVTTTPAFTANARVLVLLTCKTPDELSEDVACTEQRRAFLDGYLASLGISHTIVTSTDAFRVEARSGRYNTYWVSGAALKLLDNLVEEVRETPFRGETLVVDGSHDERNKPLDDATGTIFQGKPDGLTTVTLASTFLPTGSFTVNGAHPSRINLTAIATRQASFNTGDPAIVTSAFGTGKGLLFAFDLTGTLFAQSASDLLRTMVTQSLAQVTPAVPLTFTGGAYVPRTLTLRNNEPASVTLDITATLPAGFTLAAGAPPATVTGSTVAWHVTLAAGATQTLDWAVRTPQASGSYTIPVTITQTYGSTTVTVTSFTIAIEVRGLDVQLGKVISDLQALTLAATSDQHARDNAVAKLQQAQSQIATGAFDAAIGNLVGAVDDLDTIAAVNVAPYQLAIDNVLKEVEQRWWSALPACPATTLCRP